MTTALMYCYFGGWIVATLVIAHLASRGRDEGTPAPHPTLLSVVAGAAWPVLMVALAEVGAVALTARLMHQDAHLVTVDA